jgi:hypothetical protein
MIPNMIGRKRTLLCVCLALFFIGCESNLERGASAAEPEVNLLAMGDWGNNGPGQKLVARTLADYVKEGDRKFSAMLLAGDNFYVKLSGVKDPLWQSMFEERYDPKVLNFPFYASLGNHDYKDNQQLIELDYTKQNPQSRWKLPSRWYRVDLPNEKNPIVTVLMLDSNKPLMPEADWQAQLQWINAELSKPRKAKWLMMCAHHPLFSNGDHGDNGVLQKDWGPLVKKYNVDIYLCGHDHDLQHLEMPGWNSSFFLVGGGGATTRPMRVDKRGPFSQSEMGFADFNFTPTRAVVRLVDSTGRVLHEFEKTKDGKSRVLVSTASDRAKPRTPKSINRPDAPASGSTTKPAKSATDD